MTKASPELLKEIHSALEYQRMLGVTQVPIVSQATVHGASENLEIMPSRTSPAEDPATDLATLRAEIGDCTRCKLCSGRTNLVFGTGNPRARLMFIGEGPGRDEDAQGEPFVGRAGQLLTKIIGAMGFTREQVYIANVVKCRPPNNRTPEADEIATCSPFLIRQVEIIQPKAIVLLGATALTALMGPELKISVVRGKWLKWQGISLMPTYHPAFLLRNPAMKKPVWEDMQLVMQHLA